ncbi:ABC transporter permease [Kribbella sp. NPDC059898]|uniref:ABC transporter permease n=1 Tax=Kribbella sp. NPDC059898 TaxID=3346995 RepID=UPI003650F886
MTAQLLQTPRIDARQSTRTKRGTQRRGYLALPAVVFLAVMFVLPLAKMVMLSVGLPNGFSVETYRRILGEPEYLRVFLTTFEIGAVSALASLVIGYPLAYILTTSSRWMTAVCMVALLVPFLTSILVRMFGWIVILAPNGLVPDALRSLGLGDVPLLYNRTGVLVGMVYALLPYSVLTVRTVMLQLDPRLMHAARSLGASGWHTFRRVYWPLTLPGVVASLTLTFVLSIGYFMAPRLMGGPKDQTVASVIENAVEVTFDERLAAALGVVLLVAVLTLVGIVSRIVGLARLVDVRR